MEPRTLEAPAVSSLKRLGRLCARAAIGGNWNFREFLAFARLEGYGGREYLKAAWDRMPKGRRGSSQNSELFLGEIARNFMALIALRLSGGNFWTRK
jgi:hypothetical protein